MTDPAPHFLPLADVYEASGIKQLPDGRFLVIEDEQGHPFSVLTISADGAVDSTPLAPTLLQMFSSFRELEDLEGLALDRSGWVYAITSHSRDEQGKSKKSREKLVRFRVEGNHAVQPKVVDTLKSALAAAHPLLARAAEIRDVKNAGGFNIEALEVSADQQRLLIGFRSPLQDGRAVVAAIENPSGMFDADEEPRVSPVLQTLDLEGNGIRDLAYIPALDAYLVIGGPVAREGPFGLWFWSGHADTPARRVTVVGLPDFARAEGISPALIDGVEQIFIVSDDGDRKEQRPAHFLLLDPEQLSIGS